MNPDDDVEAAGGRTGFKAWATRQKPWTEFLTFVVSLLVLAAVVVYTYYTAKFFYATQQQVRATTAPIVNFPPPELTGDGKSYRLEAGVQNCGHSVAEDVTVNFEEQTISLGLNGQQILKSEHFSLPKQPLNLGSGGGCGPKYGEQAGISDPEYEDLVNLKETIKVTGNFTYSDGFETFHHEFCYLFLPSNWQSGHAKTGRPPRPGRREFVECGVFDAQLAGVRKQKEAVEKESRAQRP
jgi:hypothetical protein